MVYWDWQCLGAKQDWPFITRSLRDQPYMHAGCTADNCTGPESVNTGWEQWEGEIHVLAHKQGQKWKEMNIKQGPISIQRPGDGSCVKAFLLGFPYLKHNSHKTILSCNHLIFIMIISSPGKTAFMLKWGWISNFTEVCSQGSNWQ